MFKSKHSGWTWDLKRTPFGGGNPISDVGNWIDQNVTQPIGSGLSEVDKGVNDVVPGGWLTVAAIAASIASGGTVNLEGETMAADGAFMAADSANLAAQGLSQEAIAQNLAASYGIPAEQAAQLASASADAYAASGSAPSGFEVAATPPPVEPTATPGVDQILNQPDVNVNLGGTSNGTYNSLNPALPAAGAPTGTSIGMSGQLAPGTVLGTGGVGGGSIGSSYATGPNGLPATDFFGRPISASSVNFGGVPDTIAGTTATTTNTDLAKLLKQGAGSGLSKSLGQLAQGSNLQGQALSPWIHGNQNPFTQTAQQPIQNAKPLDLASLANLLKQG